MEDCVISYLRTLRNNKIAVERAIWYGSQAVDTANQDSDIDIVIVSADFGRDYVKEAARLKLLALDVDPNISSRPYPWPTIGMQGLVIHSKRGSSIMMEITRNLLKSRLLVFYKQVYEYPNKAAIRTH